MITRAVALVLVPLAVCQFYLATSWGKSAQETGSPVTALESLKKQLFYKITDGDTDYFSRMGSEETRRVSEVDLISEPLDMYERLHRTPNGNTWYLAGDVELGGTVWGKPDQSLPFNITILADTVRLTKPCSMYLNGGGEYHATAGQPDKVFDYPKNAPAVVSLHEQWWNGPSGRDGGNVVIIARRLVCDSGGSISIESLSCDGRTKKTFSNYTGPVKIADDEILKFFETPTGRGGNVLIAVSSIEIPGVPSTDFESARQKLQTDFLTVKQTGKKSNGFTEVTRLHPSMFKKFIPSDGYTPKNVFNEWLQKRLDRAYKTYLVARQTQSKKQMLEAIRDFKTVPLTTVMLNDGLRDIVEKLTIAVKESDSLTVRTLRLRNASRSGTYTLFTEGSDLENYLAPTDLLVQPNQFQGGEFVGVVRTLPKDQSRIEITLDAKLTIDPQVFQLARQELSRKEEKLSGMFSDWHLELKTIPSGLEDFKLNLIGDVLQCTLLLDRAMGNLAMYRLGSRNGLPLLLKYECKSNPQMKGEFQLSLSLSRRVESHLVINNGLVTNTGKRAAIIRYLVGSDDLFFALEPGLLITPGKSQPLSLPAGVDGRSVSIPPEAVVLSDVDPFVFEDFYVLNREELVEKILLSNKLISNEKLGQLQRVNANLTYIVGEGKDRVEIPGGRYVLAPRTNDFAVREVFLLKPRNGKVRLMVEGTADYAKGYLRFKGEKEGVEIDINENMLTGDSRK